MNISFAWSIRIFVVYIYPLYHLSMFHYDSPLAKTQMIYDFYSK